MKYVAVKTGYDIGQRCVACVPIKSIRIHFAPRKALMLLCAHIFYSLTGFALTAGAAQALAADLVVSAGAQSALNASTNADIIRTLGLLKKQAEENGTTRIIVGLKIAIAPEGGLTAAAAAQQPNEIARMQSVVLEKIPSLKQRSENIKRFESTPFMALEVNVIELEALASLGEIASIEEDRLAAPIFTNELAVPERK